MSAKFELKVLTPSRQVVSQQVTAVTLPGKLGYMTILPDHAALISELDVGELTIYQGDSVERYFVSGGYLEVEHNRVKVLGDVVEYARDINLERAREALSRASSRLSKQEPSTDVERANRSFRRAELRILIAKTMAAIARGQSDHSA